MVGVHRDALWELRMEGGAVDALLFASDDILRSVKLRLDGIS